MVDLASLVVDVPDFPRPGVVFKDVTPLLASAAGLAAAVDGLVASAPTGVDVVVGMEARGFLFGPPVALALGVGFVPVRKPGKLPRERIEVSYALEYGEETLALHADAVRPGDRVLVVDDVLATGGTAVAAAGLVRRLGAEVVGVSVLLELTALPGRALLAEHGLYQVSAVLTSGAP
ncbi:adenine phosphoribosyltransferase [Microlunatus lacustris]